MLACYFYPGTTPFMDIPGMPGYGNSKKYFLE
jgi:hypothetical protein